MNPQDRTCRDRQLLVDGASGPKKNRLGDKMQVSIMVPPESAPTAKNDSRTGKYLAFQLGREASMR